MRHEAIYALYPNVLTIGDNAGAFDKNGNQVSIDESLVQAKIAELEAAEPMRLLRIERTRLLTKSDWRANSDVTMTEEWRVYRQALRDITTQTPLLDENGQLTGINWPQQPEV